MPARKKRTAQEVRQEKRDTKRAAREVLYGGDIYGVQIKIQEQRNR